MAGVEAVWYGYFLPFPLAAGTYIAGGGGGTIFFTFRFAFSFAWSLTLSCLALAFTFAFTFAFGNVRVLLYPRGMTIGYECWEKGICVGARGATARGWGQVPV